MIQSYAFVAKHLTQLKPSYDCGVFYHFTTDDKVAEMKALVKRVAEPFDYSLPTCGTAHPRLNVIVKQFPNKESWQYSGGALTTPDVDALIDTARDVALHNNPNTRIKSETLTCSVLNEWERYAVVFELQLNLEAA